MTKTFNDISYPFKEKKLGADVNSNKAININLGENKNKLIKTNQNFSMQKLNYIDNKNNDKKQIDVVDQLKMLNINKKNQIIKIKSFNKKYTYNSCFRSLRYSITAKNKNNNNNNYIIKKSITPNNRNLKQTFNSSIKINKQKSTRQKSRINYYINLYSIKKKFSKSMIENNSFNINNYSRISKTLKNNKNKNIYSLNKKIEITLEENIPKEKILVIDLDETLIHTSFKKISNSELRIKFNPELSNKKFIEAYIRIRPGVTEFLSQLSNYYDLYIYSSSSKNYLNRIIKYVDKKNLIKKCYCRDDCITYVENTGQDFNEPDVIYKYVKDLTIINKDLRNIVFIDNDITNFTLQERNGIPIKSFYDDYDDIELYKLIPILKNLSGFHDVRIEIEKFVKNRTFNWSKTINWLKDNCLNSAYLNDINYLLKKEKQKSKHFFKSFSDINNINENIKNAYNTMKRGYIMMNNINNILIKLNVVKTNEKEKNIKQMIDNLKFNFKLIKGSDNSQKKSYLISDKNNLANSAKKSENKINNIFFFSKFFHNKNIKKNK